MNPKVPLEKLSLESFIEVVHLKFLWLNFPITRHIYEKGLAQQSFCINIVMVSGKVSQRNFNVQLR
jgi:hypothetical protein